ncbi:MAG: branched-chain-amino-acid transaminase [Armatimonadetes bacterium]|nr:branched-chain-amino-acid transaminase [Armatimonadota bacterium]
MGKFIFLNGQVVPHEQGVVSVYDHGFLYGDGVFEGIRTYNGRVFKLDEHIERLFHSSHALMIDIGMTPQEMRNAILDLNRRNEQRDGYNRITVTRGVTLGLDPKNCKQATVVIMNDGLALYPKQMYEEGLDVVTVSTRVAMPQTVEPRVKSLGKYVANIQAKLEANRVQAGEGLMLNTHGYVAECTGDNIFLVRDGKVITPPAWAGILQGITRNTVMQLASDLGYDVIEDIFTLFDVYTAQECFLTGTAAEVIPVRSVDGRSIGSAAPGPVTVHLMSAFRELTRTSGVQIYESSQVTDEPLSTAPVG